MQNKHRTQAIQLHVPWPRGKQIQCHKTRFLCHKRNIEMPVDRPLTRNTARLS